MLYIGTFFHDCVLIINKCISIPFVFGIVHVSYLKIKFPFFSISPEKWEYRFALPLLLRAMLIGEDFIARLRTVPFPRRRWLSKHLAPQPRWGVR